jgi:hypothetical protein
MLWEKPTPKRVISKKEFREALAEEFKTVSNFRKRKKGRPPTNILGLTHGIQLCATKAVEVLNLKIEEFEQDGCIIDPELMEEFGPKARRQYVIRLLYQMSKMRARRDLEAPIEALFKSLGPLIRTDKLATPGAPPLADGEERFVYVLSETAEDTELTIAFNTFRDLEQAKSNRAAEKINIFGDGLAALAKYGPGVSLMEAYAAETAERKARR